MYLLWTHYWYLYKYVTFVVDHIKANMNIYGAPEIMVPQSPLLPPLPVSITCYSSIDRPSMVCRLSYCKLSNSKILVQFCPTALPNVPH